MVNVQRWSERRETSFSSGILQKYIYIWKEQVSDSFLLIENFQLIMF